MTEPEAIARRFLGAFSAADFETMRAVLSPDVIAYITGAAGDADPVRGRDPLLSRIEAMDLPAARFSVELHAGAGRGRSGPRSWSWSTISGRAPAARALHNLSPPTCSARTTGRSPSG